MVPFNNNINRTNTKTTAGEAINPEEDIRTTDIAADQTHKTVEAEIRETNTTKTKEDTKVLTKHKDIVQTPKDKLFAGSVTSLAISKPNATNAFHQKAN